jgi:hypothetical protein
MAVAQFRREVGAVAIRPVDEADGDGILPDTRHHNEVAILNLLQEAPGLPDPPRQKRSVVSVTFVDAPEQPEQFVARESTSQVREGGETNAGDTVCQRQLFPFPVLTPRTTRTGGWAERPVSSDLVRRGAGAGGCAPPPGAMRSQVAST